MPPWMAPPGGRGALLPVALLFAVFLLCAGCLEGAGIPSLLGNPVPAGTGGSPVMKAYFLDVGQGDSAVVMFRNTTILIDAGDSDHRVTVAAGLRSLGVTAIDLLVATHPHADHIGGMADVLAAFPVRKVLDAGIPHTSVLYESFLAEIEKRGIPYMVAERGMTVELDPSIRILVLSPPRQSALEGLNENSVVLRISFGTTDLLFTGDAGKGAESALQKSGYAFDAEILKAGHHGSSDATGRDFLERVRPEVAVISCGKDNEYGHPHAETLDLLTSRGVTVYRTDLDGTVLVECDGSSCTVRTGTQAGGVPGLTPLTATTAGTATTSFGTPPTVTAPDPVNGQGETAGSVLPVPAVNTPSIRISAARFDAPGNDRENLNGEWVRFMNTGNETVLMAGWTLTDNTGEVIYRFPLLLLEPRQEVTVYTGPGRCNATALFMDRAEPVWGNTGDEAILKDCAGTVIDRSIGGT